MTWAWIPGTALGVLGGLWGALCGTMAPTGKGKGLVLGLGGLLLAVSVGVLVAGLWAYRSGQPYGVWYGLALPGGIGTVVFGSLLPVASQAFRSAEARRMEAQDVRL
jgi:hypothetical protein